MAYPSTAESELLYSSLPLWIVLIPLAGSFFVYRMLFSASIFDTPYGVTGFSFDSSVIIFPSDAP